MKAHRRSRVRRKKIHVHESQKKEDTHTRNVRKVAKCCVFPMCGSAGSKSRLAKVAGAEVAAQSRNEKLHAAVARSAFSTQNVQNTLASEHFLKLGCGKIARRPLWREAHFQFKMCKTHNS